jgi:cobalt-precorrin-5B (C1)-methyltransferase
VGTVTQPGIRVPVGEPAINPTPRRMMEQAIREVLDGAPDPGFDLSIGCEDGESLARKTFNPRLGIVGGISIIGTTGIVEPMSLAAYMASIEVYIRVALADDPACVAYAPGKIGTAYLRRTLQLPTRRMVQISNFIGFAADTTEQVLTEEGRRLPSLWLVGHPGKLAKVLEDVWDTHSSKSSMATHAIARVAADMRLSEGVLDELARSNTVERSVEILKAHPRGQGLWREVEERIAARVHTRVARVDKVEVRLFGLQGVALGRTA